MSDRHCRDGICHIGLSGKFTVRYRLFSATAALPGRPIAATILETIPNLIDYFDEQSFDMCPIVAPGESAARRRKSSLRRMT